MKNIAILASGKGTNFEAIAKAVKAGKLKANLKLLITDSENAFVRERAKKFKVKDIFVDPKKFKNRVDFDKEIAKILKKEKIDLVVLAGFMRVLSSYFVRKFKNKILNIHPALLPAFKGVNAIERAYNYGCKVTGVTIHFVDEKVDHGPIILQGVVKIKQGMSLEELEEKIHKLEHKLYPQVIRLFLEGKLKVRGRDVKIT
jgi:phosphoribosylglycinamide formyltransferase-1